jgi:hypothetical protein
MARKKLASGWHDMRAKKKLLLQNAFALYLLFIGFNSFAETESYQPSDGTQARTLPEYQIKPLPNDTFKPSEKVSEDFPVTFPVDI